MHNESYDTSIKISLQDRKCLQRKRGLKAAISVDILQVQGWKSQSFLSAVSLKTQKRK